MTEFLSLLRNRDKSGGLRRLLSPSEAVPGRFAIEAKGIRRIDGSRFCYWLPQEVRELYSNRRFGDGIEGARIGLGTLDDFRFLRLYWEVAGGSSLPPFVKASHQGPWYSDLHTLLRWGADGTELKISVELKVGSASRKVQSEDFYFRPGVGWSRRPHVRGWFRFVPSGAIFADNGPIAFGDRDHLERSLALLNSAIVEALIHASVSRGYGGSGQTLTYEVGVIGAVPMPRVPVPDRLASLARRGWSLQRSLDTVTEVSHAFVVPAVLHVEGGSFAERMSGWSA
ncbi:MAG: hypothetical protein GY788_26635, partial [bacterium]|nr:hypothetical protein [bacterium]